MITDRKNCAYLKLVKMEVLERQNQKVMAFGITKEKFQDYISAETQTYDNQDEAENMGAANKALRDFTTDLNHQVSMNKIDPVIGRGEEIEQVALALGRRTKSNVLIVGDPGASHVRLEFRPQKYGSSWVK